MEPNFQGAARAGGPHSREGVVTAGVAVEKADAAIVLVHGRGASAQSILSLFPEFDVPGCAAVAPQAADHTWYPQSFLAPLEANQPYLDSALGKLDAVYGELVRRGMPGERIVWVGFSQGACLVLHYVATHARRYGAVMGLTGGLIGPAGTVWDFAGSLGGTPVFLGSGDPDPHVPFERVEETRGVLEGMGAVVELRRYPGMPHTINDDELTVCRTMIQRVATARKF